MTYAKTWMLPDVFMVGLDWAFLAQSTYEFPGHRMIRSIRAFRLVRMLRLLRAMRLPWLSDDLRAMLRENETLLTF